MKKKIVKFIGVIIVLILGVYAIYLGASHGYYEYMNGSKDPHGIFFDAISGNSLTVEFPGWPGWPAMSIIPNLLVSSIIVFIISGCTLFWLFIFIMHNKWGQNLIYLAIVLCLFGGGFKPPFFIIIAGILGIIVKRMDHVRNL